MPRATILSIPSGRGRCSFRASSVGAVIQVSTSARVVRIAGIAFGWIAPTSAFGSVVRNANRSLDAGEAGEGSVLKLKVH
jgi:hypothetical protein